MVRCIRNRQTVTTFDLTRLLKPKSLAVVGASARPDSYGAMVLNKLLEHRYPGSIYPINPKRDELFGLTCYPDLSSVPGPVDLIYVAVPGTMACDILREAGRIGVGGAEYPVAAPRTTPHGSAIRAGSAPNRHGVLTLQLSMLWRRTFGNSAPPYRWSLLCLGDLVYGQAK